MPLGNFRYYCYAPLKFGQSLIAQVANCSDVGHRRTAKLNIRFNSPLVASHARLTDRRLQRPFEHHDRLTSRNSGFQSSTGGLDLKRLVAIHTHTRGAPALPPHRRGEHYPSQSVYERNGCVSNGAPKHVGRIIGDYPLVKKMPHNNALSRTP